MEVVRDRSALRIARADLPGPVGFVPTLGAIHAGHESLLRRARDENASVVASLFVNPLQFRPGEDFERYPRDEPGDLERFAAAGADVVFAPDVSAVYPSGFTTSVDVGPLGAVLEGSVRPGHFRGVATVVTILFGLVRPDRAYFGQKDGQQAIIVERLVRDLALFVEVVVCPTVREPDGLALSSRNVHLTPEERRAAPVLVRALSRVDEAYRSGERDAERLRQLIREEIASEPLASLEYASVADRETLQELQVVDRGALVSLAVRFPSTRLIDCLPLA